MAEETRAPVTLDQESVGRLSRIDAMQVQALALAARRHRQAERRRINAALMRIASGDYGWCARCGEEIEARRLHHAPATAMCVACAKGGSVGKQDTFRHKKAARALWS